MKPGPVEAPAGGFGRVEVSHIGLNDQVVEGLRLLDRPAFSVQFHPESAAGPNDTLDLFDRFVRMLTEHRDAAAPDHGDHDRGPAECGGAAERQARRVARPARHRRRLGGEPLGQSGRHP